MFFFIQKLFKEDEGTYQCIVSNMAGRLESVTAKLHVRRKYYTHLFCVMHPTTYVMDALSKREGLSNVDICRNFFADFTYTQDGPLIKKFL